jgi:hypothetical protein
VGFIDSHPPWRLKANCLLQIIHVVTEHRPDGEFRAADFLGDVGESALVAVEKELLQCTEQEEGRCSFKRLTLL